MGRRKSRSIVRWLHLLTEFILLGFLAFIVVYIEPIHIQCLSILSGGGKLCSFDTSSFLLVWCDL